MTDQQSDTPRTDVANNTIVAHQTYWDSKYQHLLSFARTLERELNEVRQRIIQLEIDLKDARQQHQRETDEHEFDHIEITHIPPNGEWIDEMGSCRVCGGEIPHGHSDNCDYYKATTERNAWRECARLLAAAIQSPQMMDVLKLHQSLQTKYPTE